jgi:O-antigen/teichoic acid export membrane protein
MKIMLLIIFLLPIKIWGAIQTQGFIIPMGYGKIIAVATVIGGIFNILLDYIFISTLGFIGVFLATLIIHSETVLSASFIFSKKIKKYE